MHGAVQTAVVTIISYKPLSGLNFARYAGQYGSYMPSSPLGVYYKSSNYSTKKINSVGASIGAKKILLKSLVVLKLGWCLVNRTLHTKAQCFLFSKRRFKKFSTAVGAINRAQQSSLTSKWCLN